MGNQQGTPSLGDGAVRVQADDADEADAEEYNDNTLSEADEGDDKENEDKNNAGFQGRAPPDGHKLVAKQPLPGAPRGHVARG